MLSKVSDMPFYHLQVLCQEPQNIGASLITPRSVQAEEYKWVQLLVPSSFHFPFSELDLNAGKRIFVWKEDALAHQQV